MSVDPVDPKDAAATPIAPTRARTGRPTEMTASDHADAMIDEWGRDSFPASDPPSNW